jgi:hypothetical protein
MSVELVAETPYRWRIERSGAMRVPGIVFAVDELLPAKAEDRSLVQVANVATLPGIVEASYAMPDVHWGYGFPIGGAFHSSCHGAGRTMSGAPTDPWRTASQRARIGRGCTYAPDPGADSAKRHLSRTRTSISSSRPASTPGWRDASPGSGQEES